LPRPDTVLICLAPAASAEHYRFFNDQFQGRAWEPLLLPVTDLPAADLPPISAVVAHAVDWPDERLHGWFALIRQAVGARKPVLALLVRPPESYPAETQALWTRAFFGFGFKVGQIIEVIEDHLAGRA
jgi:hypothetical protein